MSYISDAKDNEAKQFGCPRYWYLEPRFKKIEDDILKEIITKEKEF